MGVLRGRVGRAPISVVLAYFMLLTSVFAVAVVNTDTDKCRKLKAEYQKIAVRYPVVRKKKIEKLLSDYLEISKKRYAQEKADSNLAGMSSAKVALKILKQATIDFGEKGDFEFPDKIRYEQQDFFSAIQKHKTDIESGLDARKERLKNNTFSRFVKLIRAQGGDDVDIPVLRQEFDEWIKDEAEKKNEAEKVSEVKKVVAADLGIDLSKSGFADIKKGYRQEKAKMDSLRKNELKKLLEKRKSEAHTWYSEQKKVRNIKGMTIARKELEIVEDALTTMEKDGQFKLPSEKDLRRELQEYIRMLEARKGEILTILAKREKSLYEESLKRFSELVLRQSSNISTGDMATVFGDWLIAEDSSPLQTRAMSSANVNSGAHSDSPYFAKKGRCAKWFTIGQWRVKSAGMDVFQVPLYDGSNKEGVKRNVQLGGTSKWSYHHVADLNKNKFYAFRLKKIKGATPVSVVGWPGPQNNWCLEVRTDRGSSSFGFEIQAGILVDKHGRVLKNNFVTVPVTTKPAGARVYIDGERYYVPGEKSVTPLVLKLKPGRHSVIMTFPGCLKRKINNFDARRGGRLQYVFKREIDLPGQIVKVSSANTWVRTRVNIKKGDKICVFPTGTWSCGSKGESVGPAGYSKEKYPHYYGGNLRKFPKANYGALLMKVGEKYYGAQSDVEDKRAVPITGLKSVKAETWGELWFDVNEKEGPDQRRDNRGTIDVKVVVLPGGKVPIDEN